MNGNDLMNAMSGIDPKYIDEAAFELHDDTAGKREKSNVEQVKAAKRARISKGFFVALPAAAAILLTTTVLLSGIFRQSKKESATFAPAEGAASDTAPAFEAEETAEAEADYAEEGSYADETYEEEPSAEAFSEEAAEDTMGEAAEAAPELDFEDFENAAPALNADDSAQYLIPSSEADTHKKKTGEEVILGLQKAEYKDGLLTLTIIKTLPDDRGDIKYSVTGKNTDGSDKTYGEGKLKDILKSKDPLTLDLSALKLPAGTYVLSVGEEKIAFKV